MERSQCLQALETSNKPWDVLIIGGGASGLGAAVDAASRGYKTLLLEQQDFAKGTSSRSTKLVHGGVRYLQQGNIKLVMEALRERGLLLKNAPHLVKKQLFIIPVFKWWERFFYGIGLKVYDLLAGKLGMGSSRFFSKNKVLDAAPTLKSTGLRGGILYSDGQFDDARLAINLAQTAAEQGGCLLNYCKVTGLLKTDGKVAGVIAADQVTGNTYEIKSKTVINATGVFTDSIKHMDEPNKPDQIAPSQGIHLVLDKSFLPGNTAIMIPKTDDGRVLFAVPWHNKIIVGTTDTPVNEVRKEPMAMEHELNFLMEHAGRYLTRQPTHASIRSIFTGLRPLIKNDGKKTAQLSRDHAITYSNSGLINVLGGKWTTYRHMGEDVIDKAIIAGKLANKKCVTHDLLIHGAKKNTDFQQNGYYYGTDLAQLNELEAENPAWKEKIHPNLPYSVATIILGIRNEYALTVEDILSRRTRALLLDARAAVEAAPKVASIMRLELNETAEWETNQLNQFKETARSYLPESYSSASSASSLR